MVMPCAHLRSFAVFLLSLCTQYGRKHRELIILYGRKSLNAERASIFYKIFCLLILIPKWRSDIHCLKLSQIPKNSDTCSIHVVTFTLISNLATDYIQKRRGEPGPFSFEYNLSPNWYQSKSDYMDRATDCIS